MVILRSRQAERNTKVAVKWVNKKLVKKLAEQEVG